MKILQYLPGLPPVMGGGMIKYALDLIQGERKAGHEVVMLVPGHFTHFHRARTKIAKKKWNGEVCYRIINPLPVSGGKGVSNIKELIKVGDKEVYIRFLIKTKPDIIHIHSFMGLHMAFLEAAADINIPTIYTTHDYYGICPNATLLNGIEQCTVTDGSRCPSCISVSMSIKKIRWHQSIIYEMLKKNFFINLLEYSPKLSPVKNFIIDLGQKNKVDESKRRNEMQSTQQEIDYKASHVYYRKMFAYITRFHFNSGQSKEVFTQYLGDISGDIIPISNKNITDKRKKKDFGKTLRIGFIGRGIYKGFYLLRDVLDSLYADGLCDFECHIYFNPKEKLPSYIISHAPYKENAMERVYGEMDVLVLPSICKETYGLVVLEALSYGVPVIVSQNVGARELLSIHEGIGIVVIPQSESLKRALEKIYHNRELLRKMNLEICNCKWGLNYKEHICKIISMYQNIS